MKKSILLLFGSLLITSQSQAMLAPWYETLRVIDAAVEEMAVNHLKYEDSDDAPISYIIIDKSQLIVEVGMKTEKCLLKIKSKTLPIGAAGIPGLTAEISDCKQTDTQYTVAYSKVSDKMHKSALLGKIVKSLEITNSSKIKITYK